jgi:uncharacterized membrane protein HdeD (DUF308 family)
MLLVSPWSAIGGILMAVGVIAIVTGVFGTIAVIANRAQMEHVGAGVLSGILHIAFGVVVLAFPASALWAFGIWFGVWFLFYGFHQFPMAMRLRRVAGTG